MQFPKILIYGSFAPGDLAQSYLTSFQALGCDARPFDINTMATYLTLGVQNRIINRLTISRLAYRRAAARRWNNHLLDEVARWQPTLLFVVKGNFLMPQTIDAIRRTGTKVFIFHPDTPFAESINYRPEFIPAALTCDAYFIWSRSLQARLQAMGVSQVHYLPFAWDADVFAFQPNETATFEHDVVFVGGWDPLRETLLTEIAKHHPLKIWGPHYWMTRTRRNSPLKQCWQQRTVLSNEAGYILSRSRIPLNILRAQNLPDGTNMRTFEQPGCGAFTLSNYSPGADELLPDGEAAGYYHSAEQCLAQIEQYRADEVQRIAMTRHAHQLVQTEHQYRHRAQTVLNVLQAI